MLFMRSVTLNLELGNTKFVKLELSGLSAAQDKEIVLFVVHNQVPLYHNTTAKHLCG